MNLLRILNISVPIVLPEVTLYFCLHSFKSWQVSAGVFLPEYMAHLLNLYLLHREYCSDEPHRTLVNWKRWRRQSRTSAMIWSQPKPWTPIKTRSITLQKEWRRLCDLYLRNLTFFLFFAYCVSLKNFRTTLQPFVFTLFTHSRLMKLWNACNLTPSPVLWKTCSVYPGHSAFLCF